MTEAQTARLGRFAVPALLLLAFLSFAPSLANGFALDDNLATVVVDGRPNEPVAALHGPGYYFSSDYWRGFGVASGLYRPVTIYSHAIVRALFGEGYAFGHHLLNVLLNCWAVYLVWWLMRDFGMALSGALLTAALFGVHAIHSEVVATVTGRAELFAFCFGLAGLQAYRRGGAWLGAAACLLFLAFCSKESALAWAAFVPVYLAVRGDLRRAWPSVVSIVVPGLVVFLVLRHFATAVPSASVAYSANPLAYADSATRMITAVGLWGHGLRLSVFPVPLQCLYGPDADAITTPGMSFAVVLVVWLGVALWRAKRSPGLFLSAVVFFGFSFITTNLVLPIGTLFGERLYFTPSLGVCMLPALLLARLGSANRRAVLVVCGLWILGSIGMDVHRSGVWQDDETLLLHDAEDEFDSSLLLLTAAKFCHAQEYEQPNRRAFFSGRARGFVDRVLHIEPQNVEAHATKAAILDRVGQPAEAIALLYAALRLEGLSRSGLEAAIRKDLGRLLITAEQKLDLGLRQCLRSLELAPGDEALRVRILDLGRTTLPAPVLRKLAADGLSRNPDSVTLAVQKADVLFRLPDGNEQTRREIVTLLNDALGRVPAPAQGEFRFVVARMQFGDTLVALRRPADARRAYEAVLANPKAPEPIKVKARARLSALRDR